VGKMSLKKNFCLTISASALTVELMPFPLSDRDHSEGEVFYKELYSNQRIVKMMSEIIPWLDQQNAFEFS
jgi:hypothetical protein